MALNTALLRVNWLQKSIFYGKIGQQWWNDTLVYASSRATNDNEPICEREVACRVVSSQSSASEVRATLRDERKMDLKRSSSRKRYSGHIKPLWLASDVLIFLCAIIHYFHKNLSILVMPRCTRVLFLYCVHVSFRSSLGPRCLMFAKWKPSSGIFDRGDII